MEQSNLSAVWNQLRTGSALEVRKDILYPFPSSFSSVSSVNSQSVGSMSRWVIPGCGRDFQLAASSTHSAMGTGFVARSWGIPEPPLLPEEPSSFGMILQTQTRIFQSKIPKLTEKGGPSLVLHDGDELRNFRKGWNRIRSGNCPQTTPTTRQGKGFITVQ